MVDESYSTLLIEYIYFSMKGQSIIRTAICLILAREPRAHTNLAGFRVRVESTLEE